MKVNVEWMPPMRFEGLSESQTQAVMSLEKYCSVAAMLRHTAQLTYEITLQEI